MPASPKLLKFLRQTHLYVGVFIAPMLLFFALTGALQTFSLHESSAGSTYAPPHWILTLAQLHKNQTIVLPPRKAKADAKPDAKADAKPDAKADAKPETKADAKPETKADGKAAAAAPVVPKWQRHLPMKIFFLLVALGLFTSTLTGLYMAYKYHRSPVVVSLVLAAGVVVPLVLTAF